MLELASLDVMTAGSPDAASSFGTRDRFGELLAQAEQLHRSGRQRFALLMIDQLADMVRGDSGLSLEVLLEVICLRKRVVLAMSER